MVDISIETFKIVLIGESGVGKTSIISQFIDQNFQDDLQTSTGGTFSSKSFIYGNGKILKFEIWDTAGQERYRSLTKMFYKDTNAAILVYDITRKISFEELQNYWAKEIQESAPENIILAIVGNKNDLLEEEGQGDFVDEGEAREFAAKLGALFYTISAKKNYGINDLFLQIAKKHTGVEDIKIKTDEEDSGEPENSLNNQNEALNSKGTMRISKEKTFDNQKKKKKCCRNWLEQEKRS